MKQFIISLLMGLFLVNCSSSTDEVLPDEPTDPEPLKISIPVFSTDSTLVSDSLTMNYETKSRSWDTRITIPAIYIVSDIDGAKHSLQVNILPDIINPYKGYIVFYLSVQKGMVYASNSTESIPLRGDCILSTVPKGTAFSLANASVTTPSGHPVDEPYGDQLFKTAPFRAGYFMEKSKYFYSIDYDKSKYTNQHLLKNFETKWYKELVFKMYRETTRIKANVVIINKEDDGEGELSSKYFEYKMGTQISDWQVRTYISGAPASYDQSVSRKESGDKIVALMKSPVDLEGGQEVELEYGDEEFEYEGVGKAFKDKNGFVHIFPMLNEGAKLCYSFYYKDADKKGSKYRAYNTLEVPLKGVDLDPNVENEITTVFYLSDFKKAMLKPTKSRVAEGCKESRYFGVVMDIPYEIRVTHK